MKSRLTIVALISIGIVSLSSAAETPDSPANAPELRTRCTTVAVVSTTPALPYRLFADYLQRHADYQASNLLLVEDADAADAVIRLLAGEAGKTSIVVTNRLTGERSGNNSEWTGYPGMVAKDALQDLEAACPGSVREAPPACVAPESHASTSLVYAPPRTFSACSRTSWVDNQLYAALQANADLKAMGVELRPACSPADAQLEVMHNLDQTEDWTWQVKSRIGEVVTSGRVVAFQGKDVGEKITRAALSQVAITNGVAPRMIDAVASEQAPRLAPRTIPVKWLPYDF